MQIQCMWLLVLCILVYTCRTLRVARPTTKKRLLVMQEMLRSGEGGEGEESGEDVRSGEGGEGVESRGGREAPTPLETL